MDEVVEELVLCGEDVRGKVGCGVGFNVFFGLREPAAVGEVAKSLRAGERRDGGD